MTSSEICMIETPWRTTPEEAAAARLLESGSELDQRLLGNNNFFTYKSHASLPFRPDVATGAVSLERIMDEYVSLVKDNPKVWAVYATEDHSGIAVWTYVDSTDRNDRLPVYQMEWQLLNKYPEVGFDFNTALVPAGDEKFDEGENVYLYRR